MEKTEKEIHLQLSVEEVNLLLDSLGSQPYKAVFQLINKVQQQASASLAQQNEATEEEK